MAIGGSGGAGSAGPFGGLLSLASGAGPAGASAFEGPTANELGLHLDLPLTLDPSPASGQAAGPHSIDTGLGATMERFAGGAWGAGSNFVGFLRLGLYDSWAQSFSSASAQRTAAAGQWFQELYGAVDDGRFIDWVSDGVSQRLKAIENAEMRGDHFGAAQVFGDTAMNTYMVGRGAFDLAKGGLGFMSSLRENGLGLALRGFGLELRQWGTTYDGIGFGFGAPRLINDDLIGNVGVPTNIKPQAWGAFGNEMHLRVATMFQERFPEVPFDLRIRPGQTGPDMTVPPEYADLVGFKLGEIKPLNVAQQPRFDAQVENWGYRPGDVSPITYDYTGNVYWGFGPFRLRPPMLPPPIPVPVGRGDPGRR